MRSIEVDPHAEYEPVTRVYYKTLVDDRCKDGLPFRVQTAYVNGLPMKMLTLLPLPAGHIGRSAWLESLKVTARRAA